MACLGQGRLQRIGVHFWNGNTTQMSWIDLGRTLRKLLAAFRMFRHQFSPDGNRNRCTHAAAFFPPSWDATHTAGRHSLKGFHTANAGRYRLPVLHVHLHRVATCPTLLPLFYILEFPGKKTSHGIKWSAHVWSYPELNSKFCHERPVLSNYLHINEIWGCYTLFESIHVWLVMTLHCWVCASCHWRNTVL